MAEREDPFLAFNFRVVIQPRDGGTIEAAFSGVEGLGFEQDTAEYRTGLDPTNRVQQIPGLYKPSAVTLKRGASRGTDIADWVDRARRGDPGARATVVIQIMSEDQSETVAQYTLENARPNKWTGPTLEATSSDIAMEELGLLGEDLRFG